MKNTRKLNVTLQCKSSSISSVLLGHDLAELFVVEFSVAVEISLGHERRQLLLGERLTQGCSHGDDLPCFDEARSILVEDPEGLAQVLRRARMRAQGKKACEPQKMSSIVLCCVRNL